jgi:hypothetical protein
MCEKDMRTTSFYLGKVQTVLEQILEDDESPISVDTLARNGLTYLEAALGQLDLPVPKG